MARHTTGRILLLCLPLFALASSLTTRAATESDDGEFDFSAYAPADWKLDAETLSGLPVDLGGVSREDWSRLWRELETVLHGQSVESLAWFHEYGGMAFDYLEGDPETRPVAEWLKQRLDYFEIAAEVILENPAATAPTHPPPTPTRRPPAARLTVPKALPEPTAETGPVRHRRQLAVRSPDRWTRRLAGRRAPAAAEALVPRLKAVFREEGVPPALVWIAEVESTMDTDARSPVGAVGLFQLMPATAQRFGLGTRRWNDERKDPDKSARAAARYLKILYRQTGSWPLALAAYNAGEGTVGKLLKNEKTRTFEAIADRLPLETQMYVPKVTAVLQLREQADLARLSPPGGK